MTSGRRPPTQEEVAAVSISRVIATVYDALTRRMIELVVDGHPDVAPFTWLSRHGTSMS